MPSLTIKCDGCGGRATFKDLVELHKREGFCDDVCAARYSRGRFAKEDDAKKAHSGGWNRVDAARVARAGPREDLRGVSFRSAMEANCARFFNFTSVEWVFEPQTFTFAGEVRAPVNYKPDFRVTDRGSKWWVEVKGRWTGHDRQKLRKLKRYHPRAFGELWVICRCPKGPKGENDLRLLRGIDPGIRITDYKQIRAVSHLLPGWEGR